MVPWILGSILYLIMAIGTVGAAVSATGKPVSFRDYVALALIGLLWPATWAFVIGYTVFRRRSSR